MSGTKGVGFFRFGGFLFLARERGEREEGREADEQFVSEWTGKPERLGTFTLESQDWGETGLNRVWLVIRVRVSTLGRKTGATGVW